MAAILHDVGESAILDFHGVSRDRVTYAMHQINENLLFRVNSCDWMNSFETI